MRRRVEATTIATKDRTAAIESRAKIGETGVDSLLTEFNGIE
tara:strand:- start:743 stop:868 length:126 start_codon:yes stop_codon:yes gene_type:complete